MPVDHGEVLRRLKGYVASKPSHGQRDLLAEIGRLEAACGVEEDAYRRFVARFAGELEDAFLNVVPPDGGDIGATRPLPGAAASALAMAEDARPSIGTRGATKENRCLQNRRSESARSVLAAS